MRRRRGEGDLRQRAGGAGLLEHDEVDIVGQTGAEVFEGGHLPAEVLLEWRRSARGVAAA
jgi:hypothetical protein